jgi:ABC-type Fe3+-hydroxamate transport system substrate-binding protein
VRIVSLCPSTTETLIDLGLARDLVGVTKFCIHPANVVRDIEKVGGTKTPKIEHILALSPDLVLFNEEENRREDYEALAPHVRVASDFPKTVADVPRHIRWLGELVGRAERAETRAAELERALARVQAARARRPAAQFRFAYLIWRKPWMAAGRDTYVDDLLTRAGGENVFDGAEARYPELELSELDGRRTDVVLLADEPFPFDARHVPEVEGAVRPGTQVELISGDDCCWHGVRSLRGAELALDLFERFAKSSRTPR